MLGGRLGGGPVGVRMGAVGAVVDRDAGAEGAGDDDRREADLQRPGTARADSRRSRAGEGAAADARFDRCPVEQGAQ
jgi:hypothetical protein